MQYNDSEAFLSSFQAGQVYNFHGHIDTPQSHYQVLLNKDFQKTWNLIYCSIATSQIDKKEKFIEIKWFPKETLIILWENEISFFKKKTCFNCNDVLQYSIYDMFSEYLWGNLFYVWKLPDQILERIYNWILISPNVSQNIKKRIWLIS